MTIIDRIETCLIDVPTIRPHVLAMATIAFQAIVLVRIRCSDGSEGWGEGTTIGGLAYGAESPESIRLTIDCYIAPLLIGRDATRPADAMARVAAAVAGNHFAKCAVETALLDAASRRAGLPLSELLGGRQRASLPVAWTLASGDTAKDVAEAEEMLDRRRHAVFKLKIGKRAVRDDVAHVAAIKRALGDRASVRVDLNQAWDEASAGRGLAMLADAGVDLVEQPIVASNRAGMTRLAAAHDVPIMADEALRGPADAFDLATRGAADVFAVKIAQSGGLHAACMVAGIADAAGIGLYGGTMLEGPVGTIAAAHAAATFPHLVWGTEFFGPLLLSEDILEQPLGYRDFALVLPDGPGLGIALDHERVRRFERDRAQSFHAVSEN